MEKKLLLRLCLILMVALTVFSCRTDHLPENETTYNNSSKFQLTSKRISLNDAKHKDKLIIELDKTEAKLKTIFKTNVNGKVIDYGNGVSIDTDDVIYIENGPNYHTYTFNIIRENAPADAPIENIVLSPLTDGTYRELLFSYHLTQQEKQTFMNGGLVDIKNKFTVTDLKKGTFNNDGQLAKIQSQSCTLEYEYYYTTCSENMHDHGEQYPTCTATQNSELVFVVREVCVPSPGGSDGTYDPVDPGFPGGGDGGDSDGSSSIPCDGNGVPTGPQAPTSGIGYDSGDGCGSGIPTLPNLPHPNTIDPCKKTKASITAANNVLKNPEVQTKMDAVLRGKTQAPNEWGVAIGQKTNGYEVTNAVEGIPGEKEVTIPVSQLTTPFIGDGHSHAGAAGRPSGGDLYEMLKVLLTNIDYKYRYVYGDYFGVPENYALIVDDRNAAIAFLGQFPRSENYDESTHMIKEDSPLGREFYRAENHASEGRSDNSSGEVYDSGAIAMAYILEKYNSGISISKADANGTLKKINATVQQITVPGNGTVKEGVKVSKCP